MGILSDSYATPSTTPGKPVAPAADSYALPGEDPSALQGIGAGAKASFRSSLSSMQGQGRAFVGGLANAVGAPGFAADQYAKAKLDMEDAAAQAPQIQTSDQVNSFGTGLRYGVNTLAGSLPSIAPAIAAAAVAPAALGGAIGGATLAALPATAGQQFIDAQNDPVQRARSPQEQAATALGYGGASALAQSIIPGHMVGKVVNGAAERAVTSTLGKSIAKNTGEAVLGNAAAGYGSTVINQAGQTELNANRDTSGDEAARREGAISGAVSGLPFAGIGVAGEGLHHGIAATKAAGTGALDLAKQGGAAAVDAAGAMSGSEALGSAAGKAASALRGLVGGGASDYIKHPELGELSQPQVMPAEHDASNLGAVSDWLDQDNARRNTLAAGVAQRTLADPSATEADKQAAQAFANNPAAPDAWKTFNDSVASSQRDDYVAHKAGQAASWLAGVTEKTKGAIADRMSKSNLEPTALDDEFLSHMRDPIKKATGAFNARTIGKTAGLLKDFVLSGFAADKDGTPRVSPELVEALGPRTPELVATAYDALSRRRLTKDFDATAPQMLAAVKVQAENLLSTRTKGAGIVQRQLTPTMLRQVPPSKLADIADAARVYLRRGKPDPAVEADLHELFGENKDDVLEQLAALDPKRPAPSYGEPGDNEASVKDAAANPDEAHDEDSGSDVATSDYENPLTEIAPAVNYHFGDKNNTPFDLAQGHTAGHMQRIADGLDTSRVKTMTDPATLKDVVRADHVGVMEHARDTGDSTIVNKLTTLHPDATPEQLNNRFRILRTEDKLPDESDPIDIKPYELAGPVTQDGAPRKSSWQDVAKIGKKDVSTIADGRVYMAPGSPERIDHETGEVFPAVKNGKEFVTSAQKLITKMWARKTRGAFDERTAKATGPADMLNMFAAGLSSLHDTGKFHGEMRIKMPNGEMKTVNGAKSLPDDFMLYQGKGYKVTVGDAREATSKRVRTERAKDMRVATGLITMPDGRLVEKGPLIYASKAEAERGAKENHYRSKMIAEVGKDGKWGVYEARPDASWRVSTDGSGEKLIFPSEHEAEKAVSDKYGSGGQQVFAHGDAGEYAVYERKYQKPTPVVADFPNGRKAFFNDEMTAKSWFEKHGKDGQEVKAVGANGKWAVFENDTVAKDVEYERTQTAGKETAGHIGERTVERQSPGLQIKETKVVDGGTGRRLDDVYAAGMEEKLGKLLGTRTGHHGVGESEEMAASAAKKHDAEERSFDEETYTELHPKETLSADKRVRLLDSRRAELRKARDVLSAKIKEFEGIDGKNAVREANLRKWRAELAVLADKGKKLAAERKELVDAIAKVAAGEAAGVQTLEAQKIAAALKIGPVSAESVKARAEQAARRREAGVSTPLPVERPKLAEKFDARDAASPKPTGPAAKLAARREAGVKDATPEPVDGARAAQALDMSKVNPRDAVWAVHAAKDEDGAGKFIAAYRDVADAQAHAERVGGTVVQDLAGNVKQAPKFLKDSRETARTEATTPSTDARAKEDINHLTAVIAHFHGEKPEKGVYEAVTLHDHGALTEVAKAFGARIRGFRVLGDKAKYGFFDGVFQGGNKDTVYLKEGSERPHMALLGHELVHQMRAVKPELYAKLEREISEHIKPAEYKAWSKMFNKDGKLGDAQLREEFVGEVMSDGMMDRNFWDALSKRNMPLAKQVYASVMRLLQKVMSSVGYTPKTKSVLDDYAKVMKIAGEAMAEHGGKPGETLRAMNEATIKTPDGAKFSQASTDIHNDLGKEGFAATHDSPIKHDGKFNWREHTGKGEGNAAFGAGTYLSTADGVHESYKSMFTGKVIGDPRFQGLTAQTAMRALENARKSAPKDSPNDLVTAAMRALRAAPEGAEAILAHMAIADLEKNSSVYIKALTVRSPTYHVSVKIKPEQMLDWNKPLSEQSAFVRKALMDDPILGEQADYYGEDMNTYPGLGMYSVIAHRTGSQARASNYLQSLGILGHKYNAAGGKDDKHPNYVIYDDSKIENNAVSFNLEDPAGQAISPEMKATVSSYIEKVLGPKVAQEFTDQLKGSGEWSRDPKNQQATIRIATTALNPMSVANHEAMHEFFQRLADGKHEQATDVLTKLASSEPVLRQLERTFAGQDAVLKQITTDPSERVAYAFQLWASGKLKIGPQTETLFRKVINVIRRTIGLLSNDQKAEDILHAFHNGEMAEPSAMAEVLNTQEARGAYLKKVGGAIKPLLDRSGEWAGFAENALTGSSNKALDWVGREMHNKVGNTDAKQGMLSARDQMNKVYGNKIAQALRGVDPTGADKRTATKADVGAALEGLQKKEWHADPVVRRVQDGVVAALKEMYEYGAEAGVKRFDPATKQWVPMKKIDDYRIPVSWDPAVVIQNSKEFKELLFEHHADVLDNIAKKSNQEIAEGKHAGKGTASYERLMGNDKTEVTAENIADSIIQRLVGSDGQWELKENDAALGFSPFMKSVNERSLDWIDHSKFSAFQEKDITKILSTYVSQITKRAEYSRRFGPDGGILQAKMEDAWHHEINTIMKEKHGIDGAAEKAAAVVGKDGDMATELGKLAKGVDGEQVTLDALKKLEPARRAIMAMEGTLGHDISPLARKLSSYAIVYQNIHLLGYSVFSNVIDPLGILVNGGEVKDAYAAFKRGMRDVVREWGDLTGLREAKESDRDEATHIAEMVGTVDSAGFMSQMGSLFGSSYLSKGAKSINDSFFRWNGTEALNRAMRIQATQAAISFVKRNYEAPNEHTERRFAELGLDKKNIQIDKDGRLNVDNRNVQQALMRWVDGAVLRPNAAMRPTKASDPHYAVFYHLKQFMYAMHAVILKRAQVEIKNGNSDPLITLLAGYVPVMIAADAAKGLLQSAMTGTAPTWEHTGVAGIVSHGVQRAGLLGIGQIPVDAANYGLAELAGPTFEQLWSTLSQPVTQSVASAVAVGPFNMLLKGANWDQ